MPAPFATLHDLYSAYWSGQRPHLSFTHHALQRGVEMADQNGLTSEEISEAMLRPDQVVRSKTYDTVCLTRGRVTLAVGLSPEGAPVVQTMLWARTEDWRESYKAPAVEGRAPRAFIPIK